MERRKGKKLYIEILGKTLVVLAFLFLFRYICRLEIDWGSLVNPVVVGSIVICSLLCLFANVLLAIIWRGILQHLSGRSVSFVSVMKVYLKANVAKYIPGNVFQYAERNIFAKRTSLNQKDVLASTLVEIVGLVFAAFLLSAFLLVEKINELTDTVMQNHYFIIWLVLFLLLLVVYLLRCRYKVIGSIWEYIIEKKIICLTFVSTVKYALVLLILSFSVLILSIVLIKDNVSIYDAVTVVSSYICAWVLGFVTPGASGGIGIREIVMTVLTEKTAYKNEIFEATLLHRLTSVIGDIAGYILATFLVDDLKKA